MRCTRCMAAFNYGEEGIREVLNQAKHLIVMVEREDNEEAGKGPLHGPRARLAVLTACMAVSGARPRTIRSGA